MVRLGDLTSPEAASTGAARLLVVPLGATEQHGPHLPLDTDTRIAIALAERLAAARADVVVAPPLPYGSSGEHAAFRGTLSIGQDALELIVVELVRSAGEFAGVVIVSGHGGNDAPLSRALARLRQEGRAVMAWMPSLPGADAHAGHTETSILLALDPSAVRMDRLERGATAPLSALIDVLRSDGIAAVSENGVLGDPTRASAADGHRLLEEMTEDLKCVVERWRA